MKNTVRNVEENMTLIRSHQICNRKHNLNEIGLVNPIISNSMVQSELTLYIIIVAHLMHVSLDNYVCALKYYL